MPTASRPVRRFAGAVLALALVAGGVLSAPLAAQADEPGVTVSGVIRGASSALLDDIRVAVSFPLPGGAFYSASTETVGGAYELTDVPVGVGKITLQFSDPSRVYFDKYVGITIPDTVGATVERGTTLTLRPVGDREISGDVTFSDGSALTGTVNLYLYRILVTGQRASSGEFVSSETGDHTSIPYSFGGLPDGTYRLEAALHGPAGTVLAPQVVETFLVDGADVTVDVAYERYPAGSRIVAGTLIDTRTTHGIEGATVRLAVSGGDGQARATATTAADGTWSFSGLGPGDYVVTSSEYGAVVPSGATGFTYDDYATTYEALTVGGSDVTGVALTMRSVAPGSSVLQGRVRDSATYLPIEGAEVYAVTGGFTGGPAISDASGRWSISGLPEGSYGVSVSHPDYVQDFTPTVQVTGATTSVVIAIAEATSGGTSDGLDGSIEVTVTDGGQPVDDVRVIAEPLTGQVPDLAEADVDEDGVGVLTDLSSGTWKLSAYSIAYDSEPRMFSTVEVALSEGSPDATAELTVVAPGALIGQVALAGLDPAYMDAWVTDENGLFENLGPVDVDGGFVSTPVRPGDYVLELRGGFGVFGGPQEGSTELPDIFTARTWWSDSGPVDTREEATVIHVGEAETLTGFALTATPGGTARADVRLALPGGGFRALDTSTCFDLVGYREVGGDWVDEWETTDVACGNEPLVLRGLTPGTYRFALRDQDEGSNAFSTIYVGGSSLATADDYEVVAGDVLDLGTLTVAIPSPDESTLEALDLEFLASNGVDVSAYEDLIEVADPTEATEGEPATVEVGPEFAGQWVTVTINSDPTPAGGWQQVAADGTIVITLPEGVTGSHRLAVADATNQLMGWTPVDIAADVPPDVDPIPAPVYRFWSSTNKSHFYTIDETEKQFVIDTYDDAEWAYEGPAFKVPTD